MVYFLQLWCLCLSSSIPEGPPHQFVNMAALFLLSSCGEMRCGLEFEAGSWPNIESCLLTFSTGTSKGSRFQNGRKIFSLVPGAKIAVV